jgi:hypothetical protein
MTAIQGIVSPLCDQNAQVAVGPAWVAAIKALSPHITFVRGSISADSHGNLDIALLKRGLQAFADAGLEVRAVLELNLGPLAKQNPNASLGWKGDVFKNPFIDAWVNRTIALLNDLGPLCPSKVWVCNEMNLQAARNPTNTGVIPELVMGGIADPSKPSALSGKVAWSMTYEAALWLKRECKRVTTIYPAAMSILVAFNGSQHDGWVEGFINTGLQYLQAHGVHAPFPWDGLSANMEGLVTEDYARYTAEGLQGHMTDWGMTGPLVVGEWGVPSSSPGKPLNVPAMTAAIAGISRHFDSAAFFAAQVYGGYGIWPVQHIGGEIVPGAATDWATALPVMLNTASTGGTPT